MARFNQWMTMGALALMMVPVLPRPVSQGMAVGAVEGTVAGADGRPIAGAVVQARGANRSARAGTDGRYRLDSLPAGVVELVARAIGYAPETRRVRIAGGAVVRADFTLKADQLRHEELVVTSADRAVAQAPAAVGIVGRGRYARTPEWNTEEL
jgi:hypothetical protein